MFTIIILKLNISIQHSYLHYKHIILGQQIKEREAMCLTRTVASVVNNGVNCVSLQSYIKYIILHSQV